MRVRVTQLLLRRAHRADLARAVLLRMAVSTQLLTRDMTAGWRFCGKAPSRATREP
jgi:hypothetical protein